MAKIKVITGLDIGTSNIKILVAGQREGEENLEILFQAQEPSFGIRRGVIIETEKISQIVHNLIQRARAETGQKIDSVYVNIGGSHIFATSSRGTVAVSRADQRVSEGDVERVIQAAQTFSMPYNKEILDIFPREFILDGLGRVKDVIGMQGVRLETEVLVLGGFSPYKKNLTKAVLDSGVQISDILPGVLASSLAVLSPRQKELGVGLLLIGAGTSELAVFEEGELIHLAVFPIGSANITNDIAIGLRTDIDTAELIKLKWGTCLLRGNNKKSGSRKKEKIVVDGEESLVFSRKMLSRIIEARVSEIFEEVQKELKKIGKNELLPAGLILTGGGAKIPQIVELAKRELKLPCRIGKPANFIGLDNDPALSTACGLVLGGIDLEEGVRISEVPSAVSGFFGKIGDKIKKILDNFIP